MRRCKCRERCRRRSPPPTPRRLRGGLPDGIAATLTNDTETQLKVATWTNLLDALRDHLDLTGTKKGCDRGQGGACRVLIDGRRINSFLALAVVNDDAKVTTIDDLAANGALLDRGTFHYGYCTSG
jgi:xanthine dehydrogenase YagT iron-sulfur-binding subunit